MIVRFASTQESCVDGVHLKLGQVGVLGDAVE